MDLETGRQPAPAAPRIETFALKFTGDGGVYLGVWLVNLLLMVVTLGLYTPFARRRTLKYFYAHTVVAGSPLEFTGGLRRMVIGFLLFAALYLAYVIASTTEQDLTTGLLLAGWLLITPWLWASATRFRLASTRWRGIHFNFAGRTREAYAASWPYLGILGVGALVGVAVGLGGSRGKPSVALLLLALAAALVGLLYFVVRLEFNYTRLRVQRTDFGGQAGRWKPELKDFLRITAAAFGLFVAACAVFGTVIGLAVWMLWETRPVSKGALIAVGVLAPFAMLLLAYLSLSPALAYREARKFVLVWDKAGLGGLARFRSSLQPWAFVRLRFRNLLLTIVTGGFYRPFAVTSEYRMKLESLTLYVKGGLDEVVGRLATPQGAFADAMGDAVGFDVVG